MMKLRTYKNITYLADNIGRIIIKDLTNEQITEFENYKERNRNDN